MLRINNLTVKTLDNIILDNFNLEIQDGEIHVLMGPNGTGKSTICKAIMRHPDYILEKGNILYNGNNLNIMDTTSIGRLGIFLLGQNPIEVEGVTNAELLRNVLGEKTGEKVDIFKFNKKLNEVCELIDLPKSFVHRDINFNMSGGEKKKNELLHLFMLNPSFIILDEIDSGLDVDALRIVGNSLRKYYDMFKPSILIVTHHEDILQFFDEYKVHVLKKGTIVKSGDKSLAKMVENEGFEANVIDGNMNNE